MTVRLLYTIVSCAYDVHRRRNKIWINYATAGDNSTVPWPLDCFSWNLKFRETVSYRSTTSYAKIMLAASTWVVRRQQVHSQCRHGRVQRCQVLQYWHKYFALWWFVLMYSWAVATRRYSSLMRCVALRHSSKTDSRDHIQCYGITHSQLADAICQN